MSDDKHPTLDFRVNDKTYRIDLSDITGREAKAFRHAVGTSLLNALQGVSTGELDPLEFVAGFKWLIDRKNDSKLTYDDILGSLTYDSISLDVEAEEQEGEDVPLGSDSEMDSPPSPPSTGSNPGNSISSPSARSMSSSAA